jgi:hypothetical protein
MAQRSHWSIIFTTCLLVSVLGLGVARADRPVHSNVPNDFFYEATVITSLPYRKSQSTVRATMQTFGQVDVSRPGGDSCP